jgi:hypothetical protein
MDITHPEGSIGRVVERKRMEFVMDILMVGSDFQTTLGIAYMITTFAQVRVLTIPFPMKFFGFADMSLLSHQGMIMDTYHLHLVFDISSFVGVSNTAALVCWRYCRAKISEPDAKSRGLRERVSWFDRRYRAAYIFLALYLALTIWLELRLDEWAPNKEPGRCYHSHLVTSPSASHPAADKIYVAFTSAWLMLVVLSSVFAGVGKRRAILILCALHFPLHLYMAIALRQANHGKFEGETNNENEWDFGQTTAVLLLGIAVVELVTKGKEYYDFETHVAKHGVPPPPPADGLSVQKDEESSNGNYLLNPVRQDEATSEERQQIGEGHSPTTKNGYQRVGS